MLCSAPFFPAGGYTARLRVLAHTQDETSPGKVPFTPKNKKIKSYLKDCVSSLCAHTSIKQHGVGAPFRDGAARRPDA